MMNALRRSAAFALAAALISCSHEKPQLHYTLLEVIDVKGTCYEDHVHRADDYTGQIVRWQIDETKKILTYGSVTNVNAFRRDRMRDEVIHPSVYRTPSYIQFTDIRIDTNQPEWTLHGVSEGKDGGFAQGYDSTCEIAVVKRGRELYSREKPRAR
jgi:hypothetical protein